jgi:hypothetical protein
LSFYALATQFEPRPASIAHATAVVSTVTVLHALWLWRYRGRPHCIIRAVHGLEGGV